MKNNEYGIAHPVMLVLALLVVAVIGFAGFRVVNKNDSSSGITQTSNDDITTIEEDSVGSNSGLDSTSTSEEQE